LRGSGMTFQEKARATGPGYSRN